MFTKILSNTAALFCALALLSTAIYAQEQSIKKKDVPKPVLTAFQKLYPKATIKGYSKELDQGIMTYEIESVEGKIHRDITYNADGTLISIEESIPYADLPEKVRAAVNKEYPKAKVSICEKLTKGSIIQYELLIESGKQKLEIVLDTDGVIVKTENK